MKLSQKNTSHLHWSFTLSQQAEHILAIQPAFRVNRLGGYGDGGEVIYNAHPCGCPSILVDTQGPSTATFMSNGSVGFEIKLPDGMEIKVLESHFDPVEKRETGVPSGNVWLSFLAGGKRQTVSLINPHSANDCTPTWIKVVKLAAPERSMWFASEFRPAPGIRLATAVRLMLRETDQGPALVRDIYVKNLGRTTVTGDLWTYYGLHGTQRFAYNKEIWYDCGYPATLTELVMTARVPYSDIIQIKRLTSEPVRFTPLDATCDYSTFVGNTAASAQLPQAVRQGHMLKGGAGREINRFSTAAIGANQFGFTLPGSTSATLRQSLLYVTDKGVCDTFRAEAGHREPTYAAMAKAFEKASSTLLKNTSTTLKPSGVLSEGKPWPFFEVQFPAERAVSEYANSVWTGVMELYENCRAHGAKLADGIELGTRDRGQDMWPKMKEDPGRIRTDLIYALSFMYRTVEAPLSNARPLTLQEKLHGMFPRQYPSRWNDRTREVKNDNRPYTDSPLWLVNSLNMYVRETGDITPLLEQVGTIHLTDPDHPETSGILGGNTRLSIAEVVQEIFTCFERHVVDSPYGMAQILYGDWCDPIDMFGTSVVGDARTRGQGRGVQTRLSAHVFLALVETIDLFASRQVRDALTRAGIPLDILRMKTFADRLRQNIVKVAWEDGPARFPAGFLNCIHELTVDGSRPDYARGGKGYTLGSLKGTDFDGIKRRELNCQAYALEMLTISRPWLTGIPEAPRMITRMLHTVDTLFYDQRLGLVMYTKPIANNAQSIALAGRMGMLPVGTAENGEYHHCQVMMHRFRLSLLGQADTVWEQFKPMMSALRDEHLCGPFETPSTSYVSDKDDPHFGKGMYFGLSGSVDWIVEVFHKIAGLTFQLHNPTEPAIRIEPNLPAALKGEMTLRRIIHLAKEGGGYRQIPLCVKITTKGQGIQKRQASFRLNGHPLPKPEITNLDSYTRLEIEIIR
ncbi:MAG: hypothetical protein WCS52_01580 [bacterium]